jgi:hypothetical protein
VEEIKVKLTFITEDGLVVKSSDPMLLIREDGRVEKVCVHGVGHCIGHLTKWQGWMGVHGCDGCCGHAGFIPEMEHFE